MSTVTRFGEPGFWINAVRGRNSMNGRFVFTSMTVLLLVGFLLGTAYAEDEIAKPTTGEGKERLTAGTRLYRLREFEKAIEEYKAGALKEDAPIFYYNLGQCYRQLGRYEDAIWHYQRFLDRANPLPAKYKQAVETFIRDMKSELEKKAMTSPPTEPAPDGKAMPSPGREPLPPTPAPVIEPGAPWYADGIGWGIVGAGAVGTGISVWLLLDAKSLDDDANSEPSQAMQEDLHDRASSRRLTGTIVGVVGAAALVTGIVKLVITPGDRERSSATSFNFGVTRNGVVVMGRF